MLVHPILLFLDVSGGELLIIILVVFLVFGPQKMPEIARKIGKAVNEMKRASNDLTREFRQETSGIRSEILKAQNETKEEIGNITQEVTQTRARVVNDLSIEDQKTLIEEAKDLPQASDVQPSPGPSDIAG
jgi:sec-independent protein translocase protein TatA